MKRLRNFTGTILFTLAFVTACALGATDTTARDAPVNLGALLPMTGELAAFGGPAYQSAELVVRQVNEQGGILGGRPLALALADSGSDPEAGVRTSQRLVYTEKVPVIIGAFGSGVSIAVANEVTAPNRVVQIAPASTSPELTTLDDDGYVFRTVASDTMQGHVLGKLAARLGYRRVATMYLNNTYGIGLAENFERSFSADGGTVTVAVPYDQTQTTYVDQLEEASANNPEALLLITYPENGITIVSEAYEGGHFERFLFTEGMQAPEIIPAIGPEILEGAWGTGPYSAETPATQRFKEAYEEQHGEQPLTAFMYETYDAAFVAALAVEKAGTDAAGPTILNAIRDVANPPGEVILPGEWEKAVRLIRAGEEIQYVGASGPVVFDEHGDVAVATIATWTVIDGDIRVVDYEVTTVHGQ